MDKFLEFSSNHPLLVLALLVSLFVAIFSELRRKASGLINIDAVAAVKLINGDAVVVDIRSADGYSRGHIVGARNIPSDELDAKLPLLEPHKSRPVVVVCDAGVTSSKAVSMLRQAGFESVYGLKGGMTGWSQEGLPVVTGKKTRSKSAKQKPGKKKQA